MPSKAKASTATYWVRVKPYNPARGHVIKRYHAAGRMWHGGDGLTQIPHWVKVTEQLAKKLATFHQSDRDPYAPRIFDIVTEEKKRFIEKQEDEIRRQIRGGVAINAMPDVSARSLDLTGGVGVNHLEDALQDETGDIALPMRRSFRSSFGSDDLRDAGLLPSEKPPSICRQAKPKQLHPGLAAVRLATAMHQAAEPISRLYVSRPCCPKQVMNRTQAHWNSTPMEASPTSFPARCAMFVDRTVSSKLFQSLKTMRRAQAQQPTTASTMTRAP